MHESILNEKTILCVDDEVDILHVLEEEILSASPKCTIHKATSYQTAVECMSSFTYDLAIFDLMGVRGYELLEKASGYPRPLPVVVLTAKAFSPEALKKCIELGARAYLPKQKLGNIVPFLEDILIYEYGTVWNRVLKQIEGLVNEDWGPYWRKPDEEFWKRFEEKLSAGTK
ncbi:MAG: response regulator [Deltaproteobacteria bacterium]|nr:response regulator [Deltaproteobacteria bacterium]